MPLTIGERLGPYEITSLLGKGGMGEVYKAHDSRLRRDVAIKVSHAQFSERFLREARAIASLNHPNICTLFDIGPNYLVMEYIEGPTLQERIKQGAVPLEETLSIARQMAAALEAAHEKTIVHRDLKPANVKVTPAGVVKVLDFGLAKMAEPTAQESLGEDAPTLTLASATVAGTVLGTAAYMAPEQARGKTVDKRADIWAFGVVVYELLIGGRLFKGETLSDTLIDVATKDPDWSRVPAQVQRLLRRCLEKDPQKRLRDIGDLALLLEELPVVVTEDPRQAEAPAPPKLPYFLAAALAVAVGVALWAPWRTPPEVAPVVLDIFPPKGEYFPANHPAISPDGRMAALSIARGSGRLVIRRLDSSELIELPGTEGSNYADWSPDGRSLIFHAGGKLKRIEVTGGPPQTLADFTFTGVPFKSWNSSGVILMPSDSGIARVPASGGPPANVTALDKDRQENRHGIPQFLPDGNRFLFHGRSTNLENSGMFVASLDDLAAKKKPTLVMRTETVAYYAPGPDGNEYLLFQREGALMAQAFDSDALKLTGEPFVVLPAVGTNGDHPFITASASGALAYATTASGGSGGLANSQLRWRDRTGKTIRDAGSPGAFLSFDLAPNEQRATVSQLVNFNRDIYLLDLAPKGLLTRFTFTPDNDLFTIWSADGGQVTFTRSGPLFQKTVTGTGTEKALGIQGAPLDWSRDGQRLLHVWEADLKIAAPENGASGVEQFTKTPASEKHGQFSPDGKWIVYSSDEGGRQEVWLQPYPATGAKFQISLSGGAAPRWRRDGKELFYIADARLVAVPITLGASPQWGSATTLFPLVLSSPQPAFWPYAVSADGQKFLVMEPIDTAEAQPISVVTNWLAIAKRSR